MPASTRSARSRRRRSSVPSTRRSLTRALNGRLPAAVRVLDASRRARRRFIRDSRRAPRPIAIGSGTPTSLSPFERAYAWHIAAPVLDVEAMAAAAAGGRRAARLRRVPGDGHGHDDDRTRNFFVPRDGQREGRARRPSARRLRRVRRRLSAPHGANASSGTLVEIGRGKRPAEWMGEVLASAARAEAGPTAPAEGLFLVSVDYGDYGELAAER